MSSFDRLWADYLLNESFKDEFKFDPALKCENKFDEYKKMAYAKGFLMVSSSPLTRSSYHASEDFRKLKLSRDNIYNIN